MDLLPKNSEAFATEGFWDEFFTNRKTEPFEWYGEYAELSHLLHKYITQKDKVLIVGCGNSTMSSHLFEAGIKDQLNLDISSVVIQRMQEMYPNLKYLQGDITNTGFEDESFTCILDKGTFDALTPPKNQETEMEKKAVSDDEKGSAGDANGSEEVEEEKDLADKMLQEVSRLLKPSGRFVCVSLLQCQVADKLLKFFGKQKWMIRIIRCTDVETNAEVSSEHGFALPVYMLVFTNVKLPEGMKPILEMSKSENANAFQRYNTIEELFGEIKEQMTLALVRRQMRQIGFCAGDGLSMHLKGVNGEIRFWVHVVDVPKLIRNPLERLFGVFIVPQGRETEYMFGTHEGRVGLATQINFARLAVVHMVRDQVYTNMETIQEEVSANIGFLVPGPVAAAKFRSPVMTVSNELGERTVVYRGTSEFTGDFVVEDVLCEGQYLRKLIFLSSQNITQSEVKLRKEFIRKGNKKREVVLRPVKSNLSCTHHGIMTIAFGFQNKFYDIDEAQTKTLLMGLGGGLLASFLVTLMPKMDLTVVEIDGEMAKVAKDYFGMPPTTDLFKIVIDDALHYVQTQETKFNVILMDIDNKSITGGLSCPPAAFLEPANISAIRKRLTPEGILVFNLVCRNETLRAEYINGIRSVFPFIYLYDVKEDVNTILFCFNHPDPSKLNDEKLLFASVELVLDLHKSTSSHKPSNPHGYGKKGSKVKECKDPDVGLQIFCEQFKALTVGTA